MLIFWRTQLRTLKRTLGTGNLFLKGLPQTELFTIFNKNFLSLPLKLPKKIFANFSYIHLKSLVERLSKMLQDHIDSNLKNLVMIFISLLEDPLLSGIYRFKINNKNTRARCKTVQS